MDYITFLQEYTLGGNTIWQYGTAFVLFIGIFFALKIIQLLVIRRVKKIASRTKTHIDDAVITAVSDIRSLFLFVISVFIAYSILEVPEQIATVIRFFVYAIVAWEISRTVSRLMDFMIQQQVQASTSALDQQQTRSMFHILKICVMIALWAIGIALILSNFGVNVTSIIASLGIGGIAVALALQNILTDVFSSFSIFADKPFQVGDFIIVGQDMGTVQKIGIKSTRIKTLQGQELIISNKELTAVRVNNYKQMRRRRVAFSLGVVYGTPTKKLQRIPQMIEKIVTEIDQATFDRCHFHSFGDFSLNYEIVYYVETGEYNAYMDMQQAMNMAIYSAFEKEGIQFAFPTQTLHLEK